jgi:hypothetical protein
VTAPDPYPASGHTAGADFFYTVPSINPGPANAVIVRFKIANAQAQKINGWGHACGLALVLADNDYAFNMWNDPIPLTDARGGIQPQRNNVVQRNLHPVVAASPWFFPFFMTTHEADGWLELVIDANGLPVGAKLRLSLDEPARAFPTLHAQGALPKAPAPTRRADDDEISFELLNHAQVRVRLGNVDGLLTLAPTSRLELFDQGTSRTRADVEVDGGKLVVVGGKRFVEVDGAKALVRMSQPRNVGRPVYLEIPVPPGVAKHDRFTVDLYQRDRSGTVIGGLGIVLIP